LKNSIFFLPLTIGAALVLSACGGGSSTDSASTGSASANTPQQSTFSLITAENAAPAANNAYAANASISDSSSTISAILTGVSINGPTISTVAPALDMIDRAYKKGSMKLLAGVSMSQACSGGGTVSINGNVRSEDVASNGDVLTFSTNNCVEDNIVLNGAFTITLSDINGLAFNSDTWNATLNTQYDDFSVSTSDQTAVGSGDMKIAITQASATSNSLAISGEKFGTSLISAGVKVTESALYDYSAVGTNNGSTSSSTAAYTIAGNNKALGQFAYSVKTLQPFVRVYGGSPTSGALTVNGSSSSVTMTVLNSSNVRLDYSANADGIVTKTETVSWTSFRSNL
jgi:hypothetical protein